MIFGVANSKSVDIQVGDWLDVDELYRSGAGSPDWGWSMEVIDIDEYNQIWCNGWNGSIYELSVFSPEQFSVNFRQVPFEE